MIRIELSEALLVAAPKICLEGQQAIVTALTCANYETELLNSLLSIPTHTHVGSCKKIQNEIQLSEYSKCLQLGCPNRTLA